MVLRLWNTFFPISGLEGYRISHGITSVRHRASDSGSSDLLNVPVDLIENDEQIRIIASMPGFNPENIDITIEGGFLTIVANLSDIKVESNDIYIIKERIRGCVRRSIKLPDSIDIDKSRSIYDNGVLSISFPKVEGKKTKHLKLTVSKS